MFGNTYRIREVMILPIDKFENPIFPINIIRQYIVERRRFWFWWYQEGGFYSYKNIFDTYTDAHIEILRRKGKVNYVC